MSLPTPETLVRHELCGLAASVVAADSPDLVGVGGRVVDETTRTLCIEPADGRVRQVPKPGTTFEFALTDEAAAAAEAAGTASKRSPETAGTGVDPAADGSRGCEGAAYVTVDGARLLSRPARRTADGGRTWH